MSDFERVEVERSGHVVPQAMSWQFRTRMARADLPYSHRCRIRMPRVIGLDLGARRAIV